MAKGYNIMSYDILCCEINEGAKKRRNIEASENKKETSSQHADTPSSSQLPQKIEGVNFDHLDHVPFNPISDPEPENCFNCFNCCESSRQTCEFYSATSFEMEQIKKGNEENEYLGQTIDNDENECTNSSNESGYFEDMVVDENMRSHKFTGKFLEDFLNLMDAMKHLPIDTQNVIILRFVEDRRNMMEEEGLVIIRIPSLYKIWDSRRVLLKYFYKFGRDLLSLFV